jgi:hypothetical protein
LSHTGSSHIQPCLAKLPTASSRPFTMISSTWSHEPGTDIEPIVGGQYLLWRLSFSRSAFIAGFITRHNLRTAACCSIIRREIIAPEIRVASIVLLKRNCCQPPFQGAMRIPKVMSAVIATDLVIASVFQRSEPNGQGYITNSTLTCSILDTPAADHDSLYLYVLRICLLDLACKCNMSR